MTVYNAMNQYFPLPVTTKYPLSDKIYCEIELLIQNCHMTFNLSINHLTVLLCVFYIKEMESFQNSSRSQFQETCE